MGFDAVRLCTINARGGSKGVPGKNLIQINGVPLIAHSIRQAQNSGLFEFVAVSSDSIDILNVARDFGAIAIDRPHDLAGDQSPKVPAIAHCVSNVEQQLDCRFDFIVDLDATSPLRSLDDISGVVNLLESGLYDSVFTATASRRSPFFNQVWMDPLGRWGPVLRGHTSYSRRQDTPQTFDMNASIYGWKRDALLEKQAVFFDNTAMFLMPEERSWDIDSEFDLKIVKFLMESREN